MQQYDWIKEFYEDTVAYLGRNDLLPDELTNQLTMTLADPSKMTVLDEIFGLRVGGLISSKGKQEHILAILQDFPGKRYVVFISILEGSMADVRMRCANPVWKRKMLVAVGRLIALARFGGGDTGPAKEA